MAQAQGTIVQCIGAVTDIAFPRDAMPHVYDALVLEEDATNPLAEKGLTFEVEQQLGDGIVRTIALGSSDGLRRGMKVANTGKPVSVPVGQGDPRPHHGRARPADRRSGPDSHRRAPLDPSTRAEVRRTVSVGRVARNGYQGYRSDLPVRQGRQGRPVRRRRRRARP